MNESRRVGGWFCLLSLILGIAAGWWAGRDLFPRRWNRGELYQQMLEQFSDRLRLTPDQKRQVNTIFETKKAKMKALREEMRPRFELIRLETQRDLRRLLTPAQQKRFDRMEAEWQARLKKRHPEWVH